MTLNETMPQSNVENTWIEWFSWFKQNIFYNLNTDNMTDQEKEFYGKYIRLSKGQQEDIKSEIELYSNKTNKYNTFLNNICVILMNAYAWLDEDTVEFVDFLRRIEQNPDKQKEVFKNIDSLSATNNI